MKKTFTVVIFIVPLNGNVLVADDSGVGKSTLIKAVPGENRIKAS